MFNLIPIIAFATVIAGAVAQRIHVNAPTPNTILTSGEPFEVLLHQDESTSDIDQLNSIIALTACNGPCPDDPSQLPAGQVLAFEAFDPEFDPSQPEAGLIQELFLQVPDGWPEGDSVFSVAHFFSVGAAQILSFDYSSAIVNVVQGSGDGQF